MSKSSTEAFLCGDDDFRLKTRLRARGSKEKSLTRVYGIHTLDCLLKHPSSVSKWTKPMFETEHRSESLGSTDKVYRQVVNHDHHRRPDTKCGPEASHDAPLAEDARRDGRGLGLEDLDRDESDQETTSQREKGDDATVAPFRYVSELLPHRCKGGELPWVFKTTPLQGQQQADDAREEQGEPEEVELSQLLPHGKTRRLSVGNL